jgi:hypothetical protein
MHRRHRYRLGTGAERCVLYTQLTDPQSNAIYRRLGYQPVSEHLRDQFGDVSSTVPEPQPRPRHKAT